MVHYNLAKCCFSKCFAFDVVLLKLVKVWLAQPWMHVKIGLFLLYLYHLNAIKYLNNCKIMR